MESIIEYLLKSAGVLSIFVLVYHFLLRRLTFFNTNRWFLLAGIIASVIFPLIEITQTVYVEQPEQILYLPQQVATPMALVLEQPAVEATPFNYSMLVIYVYLAITMFFLGKMVVELSSLYRLIKSGNKRKLGNYVFVTLSRKLTPFSFFNYICYSERDQQSAELDLIIDHEKVHAREWHSIDLLASHIFKAVFWINPLVWLLKKQIGENLEFIADSKAKIQNTSGISYERTLLSTAASHMQPALANNFFTPFIKKRIMMLQKEASAQWNAYKYALILPVIVLFLYSFNVVEEIEYVENSNSEIVKPLATVSNAKELVFDITSATTNEQLEAFRKQIESQVIYKLKFDDIERDNSSLLNTISVSAKFPGKEWEKGFTIELASEDLILLSAQSNSIKVHLPKDKTTLSMDKNGTNVVMPDHELHGDISGIAGESKETVIRKPLSDHTLSFKIDATSTKKDLEAIKDLLKEEYNVKFNYSKLKFKNDKIVRLKLSLDDKNGYKATKSDNDTDGIDPMCVTAIINKDAAEWNLGSCEEKATNSFTTYSGGNYLMNGKVNNSRVDSLIATINGQFKAYRLDSLQQMVEFDMAQFDLQNLDSLQNVFQMQMSKQNWDSIQTDMNIRFEDMDSITYNIKNIKFTDPQNTYIFRNSFSGLPTTTAEIRRGISTGKNQPLYIINGKEASEIEVNAIDNQLIESVSVLKDAKETSIYGDKAKNGVVIIITKDDDFLMQSKNAREKAEQKVQLLITQQESKRDSLMKKRIELIDMKRAELEARREAIVLNNKNQIRFLTDSTLTDKQVDELNASGNWFRNEQLTDKQVDELNRTGDYRVYTDLINDTSSNFILLDVTKKGFEKLENDLEDAGHTFKLKTHRMKEGKLKKLKYEINGSEYTYVSKTGIKLLKIQFEGNNKTPRVSMIPN